MINCFMIKNKKHIYLREIIIIIILMVLFSFIGLTIGNNTNKNMKIRTNSKPGTISWTDDTGGHYTKTFNNEIQIIKYKND